MSDPGYVRSLQTERKREACRNTIQRPDVKAKRMAEIEKRRGMGFPGLTYRHGMVTLPQEMLFNALPGAILNTRHRAQWGVSWIFIFRCG